MCGFTIHSNGDDASKNGFIWKKGTANWIMNNELEGPDMGKLELVLDNEDLVSRFLVLTTICKLGEWFIIFRS